MHGTSQRMRLANACRSHLGSAKSFTRWAHCSLLEELDVRARPLSQQPRRSSARFPGRTAHPCSGSCLPPAGDAHRPLDVGTHGGTAARANQPGTLNARGQHTLAVDHQPIPLILEAHQLTDCSRDQQSTRNQVCLDIGHNLVS